MKYLLCFIAGFVACILFGIILSFEHSLGKIAYNGEGMVSATDGENHKYEIDRKGLDLPYGKYKLKLKNGRTLSILKNAKGDVEIEEESDMVLVRGDENTIWVTLDKK